MKNLMTTMSIGTALIVIGLFSSTHSFATSNDKGVSPPCDEACNTLSHYIAVFENFFQFNILQEIKERTSSKEIKKTKQNTGFFTLVNRTQNGQSFTDAPLRQIYVKTVENTLSSPYKSANRYPVKQENRSYPDKSADLRLECFSSQPYETVHLKYIDLTTDNTTITLLNFTEEGRLESRELIVTDPSMSEIYNILNTKGFGEYKALQKLLSNMKVPSNGDLYNSAPKFPPRNLKKRNVPASKTPFFSDLKNSSYDASQGHVYFYVSLDPYLKFSREHAALITYAPEAKTNSLALYTPFTQYDVYPKKQKLHQLDVMPFHFYQNPNAKPNKDESASCNYTYDLHMISYGQKSSENFTSPFDTEYSTPLFIDPEVKTRGVILD